MPSSTSPPASGDDAVGSAPRFVGLGWVLWDEVMVVPTLPSENHKAMALDSFGQVGGPVTRALMLLRRFGGQSALVSAVGDDHIGEMCLAELVRYDIDVHSVSVSKSMSRLAHVWLGTHGGSRTIVYSPTGPDLSTVADDVVNGTSALLLDARYPDLAVRLAKAAAGQHITVAMDMGSYKPYLPQLAAHADLIVAPLATWRSFARAVAGSDDPIAGMRSVENAMCVLTEGDRRVAAVEQSGRIEPDHIEPDRIEKGLIELKPPTVEVVDSNGAGDVFFGALVWARAHQADAGDALRFATSAAALKCTRLGNGQLPTLAEVHEFTAASFGKVRG